MSEENFDKEQITRIINDYVVLFITNSKKKFISLIHIYKDNSLLLSYSLNNNREAVSFINAEFIRVVEESGLKYTASKNYKYIKQQIYKASTLSNTTTTTTTTTINKNNTSTPSTQKAKTYKSTPSSKLNNHNTSSLNYQVQLKESEKPSIQEKINDRDRT